MLYILRSWILWNNCFINPVDNLGIIKMTKYRVNVIYILYNMLYKNRYPIPFKF